MATARDVVQMSNELEIGVHSVTAAEVIARKNGLALLHEVNPRDVIELNVSLAGDIRELNGRAQQDIRTLVDIVDSLGGVAYGGGSVLEDVSGVEPARHRTTSLSNTFAQGILDINSQQIILGVNDEALGFELYNYFRHIRPALLALSASSPFRQEGHQLVDTRCDSRRVQQYGKALSHFPEVMFNAPELHSLNEYRAYLEVASDAVNERLRDGSLDANWAELKKVRQKGTETSSYYPFEILEPHQVFWPERPRPDHRTIEKGGQSIFSIELRMPDMPASIWRVHMLNSLVVGLAYHIADNGVSHLPRVFRNNSLQRAAECGLRAHINGILNGISMSGALDQLSTYALQGLQDRGYDDEGQKLAEFLDRTFWSGNDAEAIRKLQPRDPDHLRRYLAEQLRL